MLNEDPTLPAQPVATQPGPSLTSGSSSGSSRKSGGQGTIEHLIEVARQAPAGEVARQAPPLTARPASSRALAQPPEAARALSTRQDDPKAPRTGIWGGLMQLKVLLPYVSRLLPLLDGSLARVSPPAPIDIRPFEQGVAEVRRSHRELRAQLTAQGLQIDQVEQRTADIRASVMRHEAKVEAVAEQLASLRRLVRWGLGLGLALLLGLTGLVVAMAFKWLP